MELKEHLEYRKQLLVEQALSKQVRLFSARKEDSILALLKIPIMLGLVVLYEELLIKDSTSCVNNLPQSAMSWAIQMLLRCCQRWKHFSLQVSLAVLPWELCVSLFLAGTISVLDQ